MSTKANPLDLSGLGDFAGLMNSGAAAAKSAGKPLMIAIDLVDEDPTNKRKNYDPAKLRELADSIAQHGVVQPISVKPHPTIAGRYQINQGHRRYRACKLLGRPEIEAFVSDEHNSVTQLVENIQRENLTTAETVDAIAAFLAEGMKQSDIAAKTGKSKTWVSRYAALIDLPAELAELMQSERCRDASTLYEALQCFKIDPDAVRAFLANAGDRQIVQADIEALRAAIKRGGQLPAPPAAVEPAAEGATIAQVFAGPTAESRQQEGGPQPLADIYREQNERESQSGSAAAGDDDAGGDPGGEQGPNERRQNVAPKSKSTPDPTKVRKPLVQVRVGRREGVLLVAKAAEYGLVWIEYEDGSQEQTDVNKVKLIAVTEGAK